MKQVLLSIVCACTALSLPAFVQDQPSPKKHELTQAAVFKPWTGDFDGMIQRRVVRALVAPSRTLYWLTGIRQTGAEYELLKAFEKEINEHYKTQGKHIRIHVVFLPTSREQLIPGLLKGRGDIAAGILTVTPERLHQVDFGELKRRRSRPSDHLDVPTFHLSLFEAELALARTRGDLNVCMPLFVHDAMETLHA